MGACGGTITSGRVIVDKDGSQICGALDTRTRVTVRAEPGNTAYIFIGATKGTALLREGFPLGPGEAYLFDDRGARAALYAITAGTDQLAFVITEGE